MIDDVPMMKNMKMTTMNMGLMIILMVMMTMAMVMMVLTIMQCRASNSDDVYVCVLGRRE